MSKGLGLGFLGRAARGVGKFFGYDKTAMTAAVASSGGNNPPPLKPIAEPVAMVPDGGATGITIPLASKRKLKYRPPSYSSRGRGRGVRTASGAWLSPWDVRCLALAGMSVEAIKKLWGRHAFQWALGGERPHRLATLR